MICSTCGATNRTGRKFCAQCASPLAVACPSCGAAIEVGEWTWAIREVRLARDRSPDELGRNFLCRCLAPLAAWRGDDVGAETVRLEAWAERLGEAGARNSVRELRAEVAFGAGDFLGACDTWLAAAVSDALNSPTLYFPAGLAALIGSDPERASAALATYERTGQHSRLVALDRRLLRSGLAALDDRPVEAIGEARFVIGEYARLGLPWRQALGTLMLVSTVGAGEPEVRALADPAREILVRLGAKPFIERLDATMSR